MSFQDNLRKYRELTGITAKDLATKIGLNYTTYANYENQGREPKFDTLCKIATALNVTTDQLLGHTVNSEHINCINFAKFCGLVVNESNGLVSVKIPDSIKQGLSKADINHLEGISIYPIPAAEFDHAILAAQKDLLRKNTKQALLILLDTLFLYSFFNN